MSSPTYSILLLGAGTLGLPILNALAGHSHRKSTSITLATRNPGNALSTYSLRERDVHSLSLDINSATEAELSKTFARFTTVISCTGMSLPAGTQLKLARAAIDAKVKRFFPWQFGVDYDVLAGSSKQDLFTEQLEVRSLLRAQKTTGWVVVSTGMFADFLVGPEAGFGAVEKLDDGKYIVRGIGGWSNKVTATKVEDIAKAVAALVFEHPDVMGVIHIAGQTVQYSDLLGAIETKAEKDNVQREEWTVEFLEEELSKDPQNGMKKYRAAFGEGTGVSWDDSNTWDKQNDLQLSRLDDWIHEYLLK